MSFRFKVAARADRHLRAAADWWARNRADAPSMFAEDLESALALIEEFPHAGEAVGYPRIAGLRRVLLSSVQYHLYYNLSQRATHVFEAAERMCEWRLGRDALNEDDQDTVIPPDQRNGIADIVVCLKRIRKSVHIWNEQAGRQGYLSYISHFFGQVQRSGPRVLRSST